MRTTIFPLTDIAKYKSDNPTLVIGNWMRLLFPPKKWIEATNTTGIVSKSGRYGGTYAHKDIAFKFASWISVEFELYCNTKNPGRKE